MQKKQNGENIQNIPADQQKIRLLALDIDGTLFNTDGTITPASIAAIRRAQQKGVIVVLASGRDYDGIPWNQLSGIDLQYVITTNGSAVYEVGDKKCLYEECLEPEKMVPVVQYLLEKEVYISVFIDGVNYTPIAAFPYVEHLGVPEYVKTVLKENRNGIEDLAYYIKKEHAKIQKVTLNFQQLPDGSFQNREEVKAYLEACPDFTVVDGGFANLEFTKHGVSKAYGVRFLTDYLGIAMEDVMAIGDSENDIEMLKSVGVGVAMGNAMENVKAVANDITQTNDEEGVAFAIKKYIG